MHGKHKFIKTARVDKVRRLCGKTDHKYKKFMNKYLDIRKAPQPEVVNWENQHVTIFSRFWKTLLVLFIMLISLVAVLASLATT
jgi:hypothetical protein